MGRQLSTEEILARYSREAYSLIGAVPANTKSQVRLRCPAGHEYTSTPNRWMLGRRCRICSTPRGFERRNWTKELEKLTELGHQLTYKGAGKNRLIVGFCCKGHTIETSARVIFRGKSICKICSATTAFSREAALNLTKVIRKMAIEGYVIKSDVNYSNSHDRVDVVCSKGHKYKAAPYSLLAGKRCRKCGNSVSIPQKEIYEYVKSLLPGEIIEMSDQKALRNPEKRRSLELDIYIPSLNKAIEFNGEYWHSKPEVMERDIRKVKQCQDKGIGLLVVLEKDWKNNQESTKSLLHAFLTSTQPML